MYYSLRGTIIKIFKDGIALEVNGVGYAVNLSRLQGLKLGDDIFLYTYLAIRENEQNLYGFISESDKEVFLKLIEVNGVGPKTANQIIGSGSSDDLINAINNNNIKYFKTVPGVGPKTASQIIFALQGVLVPIEAQKPAVVGAFDILSALGFKQGEINAAYELAKALIKDNMNENEISMILLQKVKRG